VQSTTSVSPRLGPLLLLAAGAVAGTATALAVWTSDILLDPHLGAAARTGFVVANVAGGAYTWWRRPASRFGLLFAATGLVFALTSLNAFSEPLVFTFGRVMYAAVMFMLVYVFVAFPGARLSSPRDRRLVAVLGGAAAVAWALVLALAEELPPAGPFSDCASSCPDNALRLVDGAADVGRFLGGVANAITIVSFLIVTVLLLARMRRSDLSGRRTLAPLFAAMSALLVALAAYTFARQVLDERVPVLSAAVAVTVLFLPVAILVGQVRGRLFAARRLGTLVADVGGGPVAAADVQALVADALGDPSLTLARWDAERRAYLDVAGAPVVPGDRAALELTRRGRPYALVLHDPGIDLEPDVVRGAAASGLLLLDNARLVEELRASRARIATATHEGRVRIERDLHDGVQPHLNALLIKLGIARDLAGEGELRALIDELSDDGTAAVEELRTLARGVYPPILRERGLGPALEAFAATAPVTVRVEHNGGRRASDAADAAVYFTVLEAIQNAIKHAGPAVRVSVRLAREADRVTFAVEDDGAGFDRSETAAGVGLVSMDDRVSAAGGFLEVESEPGRGTVVRGWVPAG
jgi:signal transduction histidine kinase